MEIGEPDTIGKVTKPIENILSNSNPLSPKLWPLLIEEVGKHNRRGKGKKRFREELQHNIKRRIGYYICIVQVQTLLVRTTLEDAYRSLYSYIFGQ
jgi:hypothetical protein